jgi:hypothetical protein
MRDPMTRAREFVLSIEASASDFERYLRYVPLLGRSASNVLLGLRAKGVVLRVEKELARRRRPDLDVWGEYTEKALFAQSICELAMLEMGWPNDHFLPDDPACVVFWNHRDSLDFATTVRDIEINFGIEVGEYDARKWFNMTLGDVIDDLWENQRTVDGETNVWPPAPRISFDN